jgi:citrate/tricarballylate utilization protein
MNQKLLSAKGTQQKSPLMISTLNKNISVEKGTSQKPPFEKGGLGGFETRRVLNVCNICGYCNGFCDVFDAGQRRPALTAADLAHLANLCHGCRNCLYACQYAPPHRFSINVPRTLTQQRQLNYLAHTWPAPLSALLNHSALSMAFVTIAATALLIALIPTAALWTAPSGGAFYQIISLQNMMIISGLSLGWAALALTISWRRYWQLTRPKTAPVTQSILWLALQDVVSLRNLRGGGAGCTDQNEHFSHLRRRSHQSLLTGLALTFAATVTAAFYHHFLGWSAPYPLTSAPVLLGSSGGILILLSCGGLLWLNQRGDPLPTTAAASAASRNLLFLLALVAGSGLALLLGRATAALALLLALHLGSVCALFLLAPHSKLVHAGYRILALVIERLERQSASSD